MLRRVKARRTAPVGEEFTGPVLVEGQASAELIRQTLVPLMLARRPPDAENPRFAGGQATPFLTRIGLRVLSDAFSVSDTPSLKDSTTAGRFPARTSWTTKAVPAKDVTLVEKGPARDAAHEPHAAEEPAAVERARPKRHGAGRRLPGAQHAARGGAGAEGEIPRAAQGAGQAVRLHRARHRRSGRCAGGGGGGSRWFSTS